MRLWYSHYEGFQEFEIFCCHFLNLETKKGKKREGKKEEGRRKNGNYKRLLSYTYSILVLFSSFHFQEREREDGFFDY